MSAPASLRQPRPQPTIKERGEWLRDVEERTADHRETRARSHFARARTYVIARSRWRRGEHDDSPIATWLGIELPENAQEHTRAIELAFGSRIVWHRQRAHGQRVRFDRVRECDDRTAVIVCRACGEGTPHGPAHCDVRRVCVCCRGRFGRRKRGKFRFARRELLKRFRFLQRRDLPGGPWGEKFLSLTVPHTGDVERDLQLLRVAFPRFWRLLDDHLRHDIGVDGQHAPRIPYVRVLEVAPGTSGDGHAHVHVYLIAPFLDHAVLRVLWWRALGKPRVPMKLRSDVLASTSDARQRAQRDAWLVTRRGPNGRPLDAIPWPVLDIRLARRGTENELIKYMVKDMTRDEDGSLRLVPAQLFAATYRGLEGMRALQASRGFWPPDARDCASCPHCGTVGELCRVVRDETAPSPTDAVTAATTQVGATAPLTEPPSDGPPLRRNRAP